MPSTILPARLRAERAWVLEVGDQRITFRGTRSLILARLHAADGGFVTCRELIDAVYGDDPDGGPLWADTCIRCAVHDIRRRLLGSGLRIMTGYWPGYRLAPSRVSR